MSTVTTAISRKVGSLSITENRSETIDQIATFEKALPIAWAGTLSTRTDNTSGTVTATNSAHAIDTGDLVDLYWSGGSRRGVTVGTVSGTTIPISGGAGDDLPVQTTAIRVAPVVTFTDTISGDTVKAIVAKTTQETTFDFIDGDGSVFSKAINATEPYGWDTGDTATNPLEAETLTGLRVSNGSTSSTAAFQMNLGLVITS